MTPYPDPIDRCLMPTKDPLDIWQKAYADARRRGKTCEHASRNANKAVTTASKGESQ